MSKAQLRVANKKIAKFSPEGEERAIAWAIAISIMKKGQPAKRVFNRASRRLVSELRDAARLAIAGVEICGGAG
jgi:uncharacterized heparinase superfamily protein